MNTYNVPKIISIYVFILYSATVFEDWWHKTVNPGYTWCSTWKMMALLTHRSQSGLEQGLVEVRTERLFSSTSPALSRSLSLNFLALFSALSTPPPSLLSSFITPLLTSSHFLLPPPSLLQLVMLSQRGPGVTALPGHHITAAHSCSKPHQQPQPYRNRFQPQLTCREDYTVSTRLHSLAKCRCLCLNGFECNA